MGFGPPPAGGGAAWAGTPSDVTVFRDLATEYQNMSGGVLCVAVTAECAVYTTGPNVYGQSYIEAKIGPTSATAMDVGRSGIGDGNIGTNPAAGASLRLYGLNDVEVNGLLMSAYLVFCVPAGWWYKVWGDTGWDGYAPVLKFWIEWGP